MYRNRIELNKKKIRRFNRRIKKFKGRINI